MATALLLGSSLGVTGQVLVASLGLTGAPGTCDSQCQAQQGLAASRVQAALLGPGQDAGITFPSSPGPPGLPLHCNTLGKPALAQAAAKCGSPGH